MAIAQRNLISASAQTRRMAVARPMMVMASPVRFRRIAVSGPCSRRMATLRRAIDEAAAANGRKSTATATVPTPVVVIDNKRDPFATVVTIEFGDRLGELLDTVTSLKNLGLNIVRAKLDGAPGRKANSFFVTDAISSEKILRSTQIEEIRMTIIKNMIFYHPDSAEELAAGRSARAASPESPSSPLGPRGVVPTTVEVRDAPNGSCSILEIETPDRPGLLVDVVSALKDININVVSAEIDTIGRVARDELFITHAGGPLSGPMVQLTVNALQYYLSLGELAKEESY